MLRKTKNEQVTLSYSLPVGLQGFPLLNTCVCDIQTWYEVLTYTLLLSKIKPDRLRQRKGHIEKTSNKLHSLILNRVLNFGVYLFWKMKGKHETPPKSNMEPNMTWWFGSMFLRFRPFVFGFFFTTTFPPVIPTSYIWERACHCLQRRKTTWETLRKPLGKV